MNNSNKNKILGFGILLGLGIVLLLFNPFKSTNIKPSKLASDTSPAPIPRDNSTKKTEANLGPADKKETSESTVSGLPSDKITKEGQTSPTPTTPSAQNTGANSQTGGPTAPTAGANAPIAGATPPTGINAPSAQGDASNQSKSQKIVSAPLDGCYNLTFMHKKIASHEDGEACLLHKNLIVLNHPDQNKKSKIDPKSICMRINGKAVKYSLVPGKPDQIILGPEAGPNAKITASYCVGKAKCSQSCVPEKDQFLSAIGADEEGDHTQTVGWDGKKGKSQEDTEVDNQMAALNSDLNANGGDVSQAFDGWILETQNAKCEQSHTSSKTIAHVKAK